MITFIQILPLESQYLGSIIGDYIYPNFTFRKSVFRVDSVIFVFIIAEWVESTSNHFWWSLQTAGGNCEDLVERFQSIVYHVVNKHHWPGCKHFKKCTHVPLAQTEQRKVKWMKVDSNAYKEFRKIILHNNVKKDLHQMSDGVHTTLLEVSTFYLLHRGTSLILTSRRPTDLFDHRNIIILLVLKGRIREFPLCLL